MQGVLTFRALVEFWFPARPVLCEIMLRCVKPIFSGVSPQHTFLFHVCGLLLNRLHLRLQTPHPAATQVVRDKVQRLSVLDIREGQRCQNRPFCLGEGGFLTFGKVNCHGHGLGVGAEIDRFSGRGGSDLKVAKTSLFVFVVFSLIFLKGRAFPNACLGSLGHCVKKREILATHPSSFPLSTPLVLPPLLLLGLPPVALLAVC